MDAEHFRDQAARARELARSGQDPRLAAMLLEVAGDLEAEAEAEAIDAEMAVEQGRSRPRAPVGLALLAAQPRAKTGPEH